MTLSRWVLLSLILVSGASWLRSQSEAARPSNAVPFQSKVNVVLVDVVVKNANDRQVYGLTQKDFQILEDGKQQSISVLEEHNGAPPEPAKMPAMPPGVFTNFPLIKASGSVNVLLLDALNTQVSDQSFVREQLVRYLNSLPTGTRLAVFSLTSNLLMLQPVTTNPALLLDALTHKQAEGRPKLGKRPEFVSPLLVPSTEADADDWQNAEMTANLAGETELALQAMQHRGFAQMTKLQGDSRIDLTLLALQQLARYLSAIPGRKNLIWFSSSFPITLVPNPIATDPFEALRRFGGRVQKTANLLTAAQVAIYPIAAEGLVENLGYDADASEIGHTRGSLLPQGQPGNRDRDTRYLSMDEIAENTGGKAFYNTNGLKDALAQAINEGAHYYTLVYPPSNKKLDGRYRRIEVKLPDGKYKLAYRRGYYSDSPQNSKGTKDQPVSDPLFPLMRHGLPNFAQIVYKIKVLPSASPPAPGTPPAGDNQEIKGPFTRYGVDFAINVQDLNLESAVDGLHNGSLEAMVVVYDHDGKTLNLLMRKPEISLSRQTYGAAEAVGVQLHYDIDVPKDEISKGDIYLRTGIYDLISSNVGTLEVPLAGAAAAK
jgi:VWFA-related protein